MKYLGDGRYQDADGHVFEHDHEPTDWCTACEDEVASGRDGLCDFCREDQTEEQRRAAREAERVRAEQALARLRAWVAADPERRRAVDEAAARRDELRGMATMRAGHALLDRSEAITRADVLLRTHALRRVG